MTIKNFLILVLFIAVCAVFPFLIPVVLVGAVLYFPLAFLVGMFRMARRIDQRRELTKQMRELEELRAEHLRWLKTH